MHARLGMRLAYVSMSQALRFKYAFGVCEFVPDSQV